MAGDWIAIRCDLANEPEVISIATASGLDEFAVVGRLHRLWSWANRHTTDGNAPGVTYAWANRYLQSDGFAEAMAAAGWLSCEGGALVFPKFDRFNSQGAKKRLLTAKRVAVHKQKTNALGNADTNARSVSEELPKEQKRTEDTKGNTPLEPPAVAVLPSILDTNDFRAVLERWKAYKGRGYQARGLSSLITQAERRAKTHGLPAVIGAFEAAMSNGYKGWNFDAAFTQRVRLNMSGTGTGRSVLDSGKRGPNGYPLDRYGREIIPLR
ncbi:hypothetical protein [Lacipirellula sp.]|uniref:hypothetical protein n=1 Tax=Lacipirellula sp. TaxID=2691419 RepID=UPI003D0EDD49